MKILPVLGLLVTSLALLPAAEPTMTSDERAEAIKLLEDSRKELLDAISNLSDAQWNWKAAPERWSVAETAEHILLAEGAMTERIHTALESPAVPDWEAKTGKKTPMIKKYVVSRETKVKAPEAIVPHGNISRDEIVARFKAARAKTIQFATDTELPLNGCSPLRANATRI